MKAQPLPTAGFFVEARAKSAAEAEEETADEQQAEATEKHQTEPAEGLGEPPITVLHWNQAAVDRVHGHPGEQRSREEAAGHCPEDEILDD